MPVVQVKFSSKLLEYTDGLSLVRIDAPSFPFLMSELSHRFSDLRPALYLNNGQLRPFCRIFHNSRDVSDQPLENLTLGDSDEIQFLLALSGG